MTPEYNVQEKWQDFERSRLTRWLDTRVSLQQEAQTRIGRQSDDIGGLRWRIHTIDRFITLSIPRFRTLDMENESKMVIATFTDILHHPMLREAA